MTLEPALSPVVKSRAPALVAAAGARASYRFLEFFTAQIRNPHTPGLCARSDEFFAWLEAQGVTRITAIESVHVATYIEQLQRSGRLEDAEQFSRIDREAAVIRPLRQKPACLNGAPDVDFARFGPFRCFLKGSEGPSA